MVTDSATHPSGTRRVVLAAKAMGILTFLVGGGWWGLLFVDALMHQPSRRFKEIALMTAALTVVALLIPTMALTNVARSSGGGGLWFNRVVLTLVTGAMTYTAVISMF